MQDSFSNTSLAIHSWFHWQEILDYHQLFPNMMVYINVTEIFESKFERIFAESISKLAKMRAECAARGDDIGANTAKAIGNYRYIHRS